MKGNFVLTCCSTADHKPEWFEEHELPYAKFHVTLDGREYDDDLGQTIPYDKFYQAIRDGSEPTTSQVNSEQFVEMWTPYLEQGKDILHVTLSSGLSGVINAANAARAIALEKYPDRRILVMDSFGASGGYGMLVEYMADMRDAGKSIDEVYQWGIAHRLHLHHWFFSTDLTSYIRGGRISKASGAIGTVLGICPLMNMNDLGQLIPRRNVRPKKKVIKEMVAEMANCVEDGLNYSGKCYLTESDCMEDAEAVRDLVSEKFPQLKGKIGISSVGVVIGAHTGPGTVALFFMGNARVR